mgnify:CR=1 FL=1
MKGILTDIGTEELAHIEMISAILYQLTRNLSKTLEVDDLALPQEYDGIAHIRVVDQPQSRNPLSAAALQYAIFQGERDLN